MLGKNNIRWAGYKKRNQRRILSFLIFFSLMGMVSAEFCLNRYEDVDENFFIAIDDNTSSANVIKCPKNYCDNPINVTCSDTGINVGEYPTSFVYEDEILYYTNYDSHVAAAVNTINKVVLWTTSLYKPKTIVVDNGLAYVSNGTKLRILAKNSGLEITTIDLDSYGVTSDYTISLPIYPGNFNNLIAVDDEYVYAAIENKILKFTKSGSYVETYWTNTTIDTSTYHTYGVLSLPENLLVIYEDGGLSVINKVSGNEVAVRAAFGGATTYLPVDVFVHNTGSIYITQWYGGESQYNVYHLDTSLTHTELNIVSGESPVGIIQGCSESNEDMMVFLPETRNEFPNVISFNNTQFTHGQDISYDYGGNNHPVLVKDRSSNSYSYADIDASVNLVYPNDYDQFEYGQKVQFCYNVNDACENNIYSTLIVNSIYVGSKTGNSGYRCHNITLTDSGYLTWFVIISDDVGNDIYSEDYYIYVGEENESVTGEGLDNIKYGNIIADVLYAKNSTYVTDGYVELQIDVGGEYYTEDIKFLTGKPIVFYNQEKGYNYRLYVSYVDGHNDEYSEPLHFYGALNNLTIAHYLSSETTLNQKIIVKDENWNNLEDVQVQVAIDEGGSLPTKYTNASGEVTWLITDNYFGKVFTFSFIHDDYITSPQHFLEFEMNEDSETRYFQFNYNDIPQDNRSEYCSLTGFVTSNDTGSGLYNVGVEYFERCTYGECNNEYTTTLTDGEFYFNHKIPLHTNFQLRFDGQKVAHGDYLTGMLYCNESKNITQNIALIIQDDYTATSSYSYEVTVINGATNEPLRDVLVELVEESVYNTLTLNTNHDGYVKFRNIPSSNYWVLLSKEGYRDVILDYNRKGNIYERKDRIEMFDEDKDYYSVSGTFYREDNSGHKSVIINGYVTVSNTDGFQVKRTKTGVNGKYVLKNLEEGDYCIQASFNDTISKQECFDLNTDYNGVDFVVNTQQQDSLTELRNLIQFGINVLPSMIIITVFLMFINIMGKALNFD